MALEAGIMSVTIEYAKDLKNRDFLGKQDPYCILRVGGQTFRTRTAKDGGRNPVWNETIRINLMSENDVTVDIMDEDVGRDDVIGTATVSLSRARQVGSDRVETAVFSAKSRKQHGFVSVVLKWAPHRVTGMQSHPQWMPVQYGGLPQQVVSPGGPNMHNMTPCYVGVPQPSYMPVPAILPYQPYMTGVAGPPGMCQAAAATPAAYK